MICGSLDEREVWGRLETCICLVEFLYCSPETIAILLIGGTPKKIKSLNYTHTHTQTPKPLHSEDLSLAFSYCFFCSVQFSCSVVSDSLQPRESQHARPPCPPPTPLVLFVALYCTVQHLNSLPGQFCGFFFFACLFSPVSVS